MRPAGPEPTTATRCGRADPSQHARQRQPLHDQPDRFGVLALAHELHVALNVDPRRAGGNTGRAVFLVDGERDGDGLGKGPADGLAGPQPRVPVVGDGDGAHLGALAAARAHALLDVARFAADRDTVVADEPAHLLDLAVGVERNVRVLGDLHHLGGPDAGGTIEGREGLVELQHVAADGGLLLDQVDLVAAVGDVERGLHAGDAATHHHHVGVHGHFAGFQGVMAAHPLNGCGRQRFGLARGVVLIHGDPGHLLPHRGHLEQIRVDPAPPAGRLECFLMQPRRAGSHHHPVQVVGLDVVFDHLLAGVRAHELVIARNGHVRELPRKGRHLLHPDAIGDVDPAMADVESDACHHGYSLLTI